MLINDVQFGIKKDHAVLNEMDIITFFFNSGYETHLYLPSVTRKGMSFIRRCISWKFIFWVSKSALITEKSWS